MNYFQFSRNKGTASHIRFGTLFILNADEKREKSFPNKKEHFLACQNGQLRGAVEKL